VPQGQGYHAPQAAAIDEYGGMLEWLITLTPWL
jgi:hypothetical protein